MALTAKRDVLGTFATPGEAVQALDAYNAQNTPAARLKCTFADAYAQWKAQPKFDKLSTDMKKGYELAYAKAAPLYDRQLRDLKAADYQQVIDQMVEKGLSRSSCEKQRTLFSQICEWAMAQDIINKNYAMLLQLPAATGKAERTLTAQEIEQISSRQDDPKLGQTAQIAMVLLYTGMRIDELLSMRCDDVHLKERYMQGGEKTEAGKNRIIPILDPIYKIIAFWMLDSGCEWLIPSKAGQAQRGYKVSGLDAGMPHRGGASAYAAPHGQQQDGGVRAGKDRRAGHLGSQKFFHHGQQVRLPQ